MREDQIKLADIELGTIEMRSLGNIIKVNGIVSVAPQESWQLSACHLEGL